MPDYQVPIGRTRASKIVPKLSLDRKLFNLISDLMIKCQCWLLQKRRQITMTIYINYNTFMDLDVKLKTKQ